MPWNPASGVQSTVRIGVCCYVCSSRPRLLLSYHFVWFPSGMLGKVIFLFVWELRQNNSKYLHPDLWWDWDKNWNCTACNCRINTGFYCSPHITDWVLELLCVSRKGNYSNCCFNRSQFHSILKWFKTWLYCGLFGCCCLGYFFPFRGEKMINFLL